MSEKSKECQRCNGTGNVKKILEPNGNTPQLSALMIVSFFIGGIFGVVYFILLKIILPFKYFGIIFYILGGISFFLVYFNYPIDRSVKKYSNTFFETILEKPKLIIIIFSLSALNIIIGYYLLLSNDGFIILLNIIYFIIQGTCIVLIIFILSAKIRTPNDNIIICPLCEGKKFIDEKTFNQMERCKDCGIYCGYEDSLREKKFCKKCEGKGYKLKIN